MEDVRRSWLLIPATKVEVIEAAWTLDADVVVLDLEDTVHDRRKPAAREAVREAIGRVRRGGAEVFVRGTGPGDDRAEEAIAQARSSAGTRA